MNSKKFIDATALVQRALKVIIFMILSRFIGILCAKIFAHVKKTFLLCNLLQDFIVDYRVKF